MNGLLIAGIVGLVIWWHRQQSRSARRAHRADDDSLSHALRPTEGWIDR